jgi:hypothetical protein
MKIYLNLNPDRHNSGGLIFEFCNNIFTRVFLILSYKFLYLAFIHIIILDVN